MNARCWLVSLALLTPAKVWKVPVGGPTTDIEQPEVSLEGHYKKVILVMCVLSVVQARTNPKPQTCSVSGLWRLVCAEVQFVAVYSDDRRFSLSRCAEV